MSEKVRTICVDTLTSIQDHDYMTDKKKPNHDKWRDYGQSIYRFVLELHRRGFEIILVIGHPGTGKTTGQYTLPHNTNIWYNADFKNPVWAGGPKEYGKKGNPRLPYHIIPNSYQDILDHLDVGLEKGMFEEDRYAFLLGHIENFKEGNKSRSKLKTLGKLANKMEIEGKMETVFYAEVDLDDEGKPAFSLVTQNNGFNTARSPQGLFEFKIPNDYNLVVQELIKYYNT